DPAEAGPGRGPRTPVRCRMGDTGKAPHDVRTREDRMIAETVCSAVAVAGLGIAGVLAFRKRFLKAARTAAYAFVPLGLVMTGAVEWAVDTAFSPTAWAGFGVLGAAWLMFMGTRAVERRRAGAPAKEPKAA